MRFATTHWLSQLYPIEYVRALRTQFERFGHELTVLTPRDLVGRYRPKLEWFAPWNAHLRPAVVFDLDTYIVGDPAPFLGVDPTKLWMIRQFLQEPKHQRAESGIFVAPDNDALCDAIWQRAVVTQSERDGDFLRQFPHTFLPDVVDGILSYKAHKLQNGYPAGTRVICFHGIPRPRDTTGWAQEWWQTSLS